MLNNVLFNCNVKKKKNNPTCCQPLLAYRVHLCCAQLSDWALAQVVQTGSREPTLGDTQKPPGHSSGQAAQRGSALAEWLDHMTFRSPFQPQPPSGSVNKLSYWNQVSLWHVLYSRCHSFLFSTKLLTWSHSLGPWNSGLSQRSSREGGTAWWPTCFQLAHFTKSKTILP